MLLLSVIQKTMVNQLEINADFSQRSLLHTTQIEWQNSPMKGVRRRVLDRVGKEVARATSIVSYDPGSHFSPHVHTGGEEFIVLEGVFQDEHGDYPPGTYIRNPPESKHTPGSNDGCVIFVKLWQFDLQDRHAVTTDMNRVVLNKDATRSGVKFNTLFEDARETVRLEHWAPGAQVSIDTSGGAELLVLEGGFIEGKDTLDKLAWMRVPIDGSFEATAGSNGTKVWVKTGHLRFTEEEKQRIVAHDASSS